MTSHAVAQRCSSSAGFKPETRDRLSWAMKWMALCILGCAGAVSCAQADERLAQAAPSSGQPGAFHVPRPAQPPSVETAAPDRVKIADQIRKMPPLPVELTRPGEP